jgi:hypothetical protein
MTEVLPRANSQNVATMMMGQGLRGRPTERWQDKSREVRGRRLVGNGKTIRHFARCASYADSLHNQEMPRGIRTRRTSRHLR